MRNIKGPFAGYAVNIDGRELFLEFTNAVGVNPQSRYALAAASRMIRSTESPAKGVLN